MTNMKPRKLEHYKYFVPIAWTVCIGFAGFVGMLAMELNDSIQHLETSNISIEQRVQNLEDTINEKPL